MARAAKCAVRSRVSRSFKIAASSLACSRFGRYKRSSAFRALIKPFSYASRTTGMALRFILESLLRCPGLMTSGMDLLQLRKPFDQAFLNKFTPLDQIRACGVNRPSTRQLLYMGRHD